MILTGTGQQVETRSMTIDVNPCAASDVIDHYAPLKEAPMTIALPTASSESDSPSRGATAQRISTRRRATPLLCRLLPEACVVVERIELDVGVGGSCRIPVQAHAVFALVQVFAGAAGYQEDRHD